MDHCKRARGATRAEDIDELKESKCLDCHSKKKPARHQGKQNSSENKKIGMNESRLRLQRSPNRQRETIMPNYSVFPDYLVDSRARNLEELALTDVCRRLKISKPALNWISEKRFGAEWFEDDVLGWCAKDGRTIFIRHDCSPFQIANTVVHEARHVWQSRNPMRFPIPGKTYTRTMNREQAERDCRIFEMEFWAGREKRDGSFDDIERILTAMRIESARAQIQATSRHHPFKQQGLRYSRHSHTRSSMAKRGLSWRAILNPATKRRKSVGLS